MNDYVLACLSHVFLVELFHASLRSLVIQTHKWQYFRESSSHIRIKTVNPELTTPESETKCPFACQIRI
jgi:hypothetical protein